MRRRGRRSDWLMMLCHCQVERPIQRTVKMKRLMSETCDEAKKNNQQNLFNEKESISKKRIFWEPYKIVLRCSVITRPFKLISINTRVQPHSLATKMLCRRQITIIFVSILHIHWVFFRSLLNSLLSCGSPWHYSFNFQRCQLVRYIYLALRFTDCH